MEGRPLPQTLRKPLPATGNRRDPYARAAAPLAAIAVLLACGPAVADPGTVLAELQSADRLLVQQVFKPIANEYRISMPSPGSGEEGRPLLYVKQKKMKIKEDIRFRVSPDDEAHLFMIKSKSVFEFRGRHEVLDVDGCSKRTRGVGSSRSSAGWPTWGRTGSRC